MARPYKDTYSHKGFFQDYALSYAFLFGWSDPMTTKNTSNWTTQFLLVGVCAFSHYLLHPMLKAILKTCRQKPFAFKTI